MLWRNRGESTNVIDQRALGGKAIGGGGLILGAIVVYLMGGNPLLYLAQNINQGGSSAPASDSRQADQKSFVSVVLKDTEEVWFTIFKENSRMYQEPKLVLFRGRVDSGCGRASQSAGPFYCPADQRLYLDLSFLDELSGSLGAKGEFAGAYVIAHEVGHHVQNLLQLDKSKGSVQVELQADCLAGVWAKRNQSLNHVLEENDLSEAMEAAAAVGDDRLQQRSQGYVVPDSFTHGSSAQRVAAFKNGFDGGNLQACLN